MIARAPHVRTETRRVYVSARGVKLTKHAAYIAAAKKLIADRCHAWDDARLDAVTSTDHDGNTVVSESYEPCSKTSGYQCRFHKQHEPTSYDYDGEPIGPYGMAHYRKVLPRLVRFLKFVDKRMERAS